MKKFLIISALALSLAVIGCTKTKKEIDWVSTILLYILNTPQNPGNRCLITKDSANVFCKQYRSGYTDADFDSECRGSGNTVLTTLQAAGLTDLGKVFGTVTTCPAENLLGSCEVRQGDDRGKAGQLYFYNGQGWDAAKADVVCKQTDAQSTFNQQ